ncbi:uncharacterized protein LOC133737344 [Rosa rugosa]|uniref:uncharacterized protein LOC133737344 n=1 Tax=Rosa rugosa TaxID=74645 RepID=UPI002B40A0B4|nr:uncharacterized protein LOC133737344 [Rosa rugosa]
MEEKLDDSEISTREEALSPVLVKKRTRAGGENPSPKKMWSLLGGHYPIMEARREKSKLPNRDRPDLPLLFSSSFAVFGFQAISSPSGHPRTNHLSWHDPLLLLYLVILFWPVEEELKVIEGVNSIMNSILTSSWFCFDLSGQIVGFCWLLQDLLSPRARRTRAGNRISCETHLFQICRDRVQELGA